MTHPIPATLVRDARERVALSSTCPNAPICHERDQTPSGLPRFAGTRLTLGAAVRKLGERRHARSQYRALKRNLATYTTRADVDDLLGTIQEQEGDDAEMIRGILADNLQQQRSHHLASFRPHA